MSNILHFPTTKVTTASRSNGVRQYAAKPSWVIASQNLNRKITEMETKGWIVDILSAEHIICTHSKYKALSNLSFIHAQQLQKMIEKREGGKSS